MSPNRLFCTCLTLILSMNIAWADSEHSVTVSGSGSVDVKPDIARIQMSVIERNPSLQDAQHAVANVTVEVLKLLDELEIDRQLITTIGATVRPDYRWNRDKEQQELLGYVAERSIQIELRDLDKLGVLIEGAVQAGVNQVSPPVLDYQERSNAYRQALARAAEDARSNATTIARALDTKLGKVIELNTLPNAPGPQPMRMMQAEAMAADSGSQTYNAGNIHLEAELTATFELVN
jgi:uncharacterized protein YggE